MHGCGRCKLEAFYPILCQSNFQISSITTYREFVTNIYQDIAKAIRSNAKEILESKNIDSTIRTMGDLFYTGSYALDLMTWNDIDMQIVFKEDVNPIEALSSLFNFFVKDPDFIEAQMIHFRGNFKPKMPRGIYLGIKMDCPDLGGIWKLDIWSLTKPDFEKNRSLIKTLSSQIDSQSRDLILELKHEMMAGSSA
jgi:hypothetical protein